MALTTANSPERTPFLSNQFLWTLTLSFITCWTYGWFLNHNMENWIIENALVMISLPTLIITRKYYRFSDLSYCCFFIFLLLHCYGAFYAYTHNALGEWLKQKYHLWRNPYDRIVHFSFGFFMAYPIRELLLIRFKTSPVKAWLYPVEIAFSMGTVFEMLEWAVASCTDSATGDTYVATQGDVWDAHKDIMMAALGAAISMLVIFSFKKFLAYLTNTESNYSKPEHVIDVKKYH